MGNQLLHEYEDHWPTQLGVVSVADGTVTFRGHDLLNELEDLSWMDLLMYGITGRRFSAAQLELFQGLWKISVSYPEPRIWNNRVAALGGSVRSTPGLALGAAIAVTDATIYGQRPMIGVFDFLQRARVTRDAGETLEAFVARELKTYRGIPGYGRPLRSVDERLAPVERLARRLGLWGGTYTVLAFEVANILKNRRMGMNVAAIAGGLYADQGLTATEYSHATVLAFSAGMVHCESDAAGHPEGTLFPLRCDRLNYSGPQRRVW
ncbi:hypothetical protein [Immundisolibacter sp.]|uniref:hypothetical protein n=1 Tax=Immundisolibacter sp. TaxID=1934948 RepID=UPI0035614236